MADAEDEVEPDEDSFSEGGTPRLVGATAFRGTQKEQPSADNELEVTKTPSDGVSKEEGTRFQRAIAATRAAATKAAAATSEATSAAASKAAKAAAATKQAALTKSQELRDRQAEKRGSIMPQAPAAPSVLEPMPSEAAIKQELADMLNARGEKEHVKEKVLGMGLTEQWMMLQGYRQMIAKEQAEVAAGNVNNTPEAWVTIVHVEPTAAKLEELAVLIRTSQANPRNTPAQHASSTRRSRRSCRH